jgi:AraC family transcriptional regulator of adaptative response / DNA-3-methyladenine glycosylase II
LASARSERRREETRARLMALPGVGEWTATYVAMRVLGDPDAFLAGDLGVRRALERLGRPGDPAAALRRAERWRPWRAYGLMYLWSALSHIPRRRRVVRLEPAELAGVA